MLELEEVRNLVTGFDREALLHRWQHPDPSMDVLAAAAIRVAGTRGTRPEIFGKLWELATNGEYETPPFQARAAVPFLDEPWYC